MLIVVAFESRRNSCCALYCSVLCSNVRQIKQEQLPLICRQMTRVCLWIMMPRWYLYSNCFATNHTYIVTVPLSDVSVTLDNVTQPDWGRCYWCMTSASSWLLQLRTFHRRPCDRFLVTLSWHVIVSMHPIIKIINVVCNCATNVIISILFFGLFGVSVALRKRWLSLLI